MNQESHSNLIANSAKTIEKAILCTLLSDATFLRAVNDIISLDDFFSEPAKIIFKWIGEEVSKGNSIDQSVAMAVFSGNGRVEPFLFEILTTMPSVDAIKRHAEELCALSVKRHMLKTLTSAIASISNGASPIESDLAKISQSLSVNQMKLNSNQKSTKSYADIKAIWKEKFQKKVAGITSYTPTGYTDLDRIILGAEPQDLIIVGARPSMGKTTFAMNVVENMALDAGKNCMVFSLEMPGDALYQRSLSSVGGVDFEDLRKGSLKIGDVEKVGIANEKLAAANIFVDDTPSLTLAQLSSRAHAQNEKTPLSLIMVDYLQLMKVSNHTLGNRNEGIGEISRGLKQLARDLNCPVIALSQLSRDLERRPNKRPINSDLRDSGSIEQDADIIIFLYRDEVYDANTAMTGIAEIIIGKQRNGPLDTAFLSFAKGQSRFSDLDFEQKARLESIQGRQTNSKNDKGSKGKEFKSRSSSTKTPAHADSDAGQASIDQVNPWDDLEVSATI